ncbi:trypsin, alkaline B-like [Helicoverpa zea]|uniref:trypsin, alkaline B-like n=1 Tax=Helicoverpa zea TaxID=7113 RepID=UPI001F565C06|nr:trypsin, alkaline B-like [Helicoverpa zea]
MSCIKSTYTVYQSAVTDNMRLLVVFALCIAAVAATGNRIVGGTVTTIDRYPTIAAMLYAPNAVTFWQSCGGTILNNRALLTAAHCTHNRGAVNRFRIRVGSTWANSGGVVHNVNQNIIHPQFDSRTLNNDIAILRSTTTFSFNNNVRPGSIAGANYNPADNQAVWAAGWGDTFSGSNQGSEQLRHVQLVIINQNTCRNNYATRLTMVNENMICAGWPSGGRDQCQGDSGGPLYHNGIVVGVSSFGIGCGDAFFPGVSARVSRYTSWISSNA